MRVFTTYGKVNFVDDNDVLIGYDWLGSCCEDFGWSLTHNSPENLAWKEILANENILKLEGGDHTLIKTLPDKILECLEPYYFVRDFFVDKKVIKDYEEGGFVYFKLLNNLGKALYLVLYNFHNGYYSHGFEVKVGNEKLWEGYL